MMLPVRDQALQQVGSPQDGTVDRGQPAQGHVITPASAGMAAVEHKLFRAQASQPGLLVQNGRVLHQRAPGRGGVDIDFDYARIRGDFKGSQARILGRGIPLDEHRDLEPGGGLLDVGDECQIVFQITGRRHENI